MNENTNLTPRKIVEYLDQYIIGQSDAKRSVAVALRNRWRASRLTPEMAKEVSPKNILLIGPTGVGKTEIARRIATLTRAPLRQGRSNQVHRSWLRRPRRRVHDP